MSWLTYKDNICHIEIKSKNPKPTALQCRMIQTWWGGCNKYLTFSVVIFSALLGGLFFHYILWSLSILVGKACSCSTGKFCGWALDQVVHGGSRSQENPRKSRELHQELATLPLKADVVSATCEQVMPTGIEREQQFVQQFVQKEVWEGLCTLLVGYMCIL